MVSPSSLSALALQASSSSSSSAISSFSSASMHNPSPQGMAVGIIHGVVLEPVLKEVTNEGSVWVSYWSSLARPSIVPTLCVKFLHHYSSPAYEICIYTCSSLLLTYFFLSRSSNLTSGSHILPQYQAHCLWRVLSLHHAGICFATRWPGSIIL